MWMYTVSLVVRIPHTLGQGDTDRTLNGSISGKWAIRELYSTDVFDLKYYFEVTGSIFDLNNWSVDD